MEIPQAKVCTKCGLSKSLDEFADRKDTKDGKRAYCSLCQRIQGMGYNAKNATKMKAYNDARVSQPKIIPEAKRCNKCQFVKPITEFGKSRHTKDMHTTLCLACKRIANDENEEKRRAAYFANQEEKKAYARIHYLDNKTKMNQQSKAWAQAHPEFGQAQAKRRRAQKAGSEVNDLTHEQWCEIQEAQGHRCYYCGKRCKGKLTQDHLTPLSKGGAHTLHNVIGACRACNSRKFTGPVPKPVQPLLLSIAPARKPKKKVS